MRAHSHIVRTVESHRASIYPDWDVKELIGQLQRVPHRYSFVNDQGTPSNLTPHVNVPLVPPRFPYTSTHRQGIDLFSPD